MTDSLGSRQSLWHAQSTKDFSPGVPVGPGCRTIQDLLNALDQKERVLPLALCDLHVCVPQGPFLINDKKLQWAGYLCRSAPQQWVEDQSQQQLPLYVAEYVISLYSKPTVP